ncbi:hypothetical protein F5878DRAFT_697103 [Lentinula raphanica]|uniref:HECT domain-containing protein n=1 Tax=Lentinula raphanica TaxID=153919 RepID=A0AA38P0V0_9AGAR|nr:hypothetical protein F5878DRAFT_697103 [Lentinula raphanica]
MDHTQWIQQSLQAMIATNPQLFLQMLNSQQNPVPSSALSSNTSASISQFPMASAPNPAPLSVASPPNPAPLSVASPSMPLLATPTSIPPSATPAHVASSIAPTSSFFNRHERLAIQLLRFTGKCNINNTAKTPRLIPGQVDSADMTLCEVVFDTNNYGIAKYTITNTKKFILHTIIRSPNVSLNLNLKEKGLGSDDTVRQHHCLSKRIYGIFRADTNAYVDEGYTALDEDEIEFGCTHGDANDSDEEVGVVAQMLRDNSETLPAPRNSVSNPRNRRNSSSQNSPLSHTNILAGDMGLDEAETLWVTDWVPLQEPDEDQLFYVHDRSSLFRIVNDRIRAVTEAEPLGFVVKGENPQKMLPVYIGLVQRAVDEEDFSALLSQNRHFQLSHERSLQVLTNAHYKFSPRTATDENGFESYVTSGPGVEKEVMDLFLKAKLNSHVHDFLIQVIDEYTTLSTVPLASSADLTEAKKNELTLFGATVGLSLVHGIYPGNINPLLLVYLLNSNNLKSLTKPLVLELFPDLHRTLSHFATYHNVPVSALHDRSKSLHRSLAWTMLHNAIVGPVATDHPYFRAFAKGLSLPCKPIQFDLSKIAAFCYGGISEFVLSLLESRITGKYEALRLEYTDKTCAATRTALQDAYETVPGWSGFLFSDVFRAFLEDSGIPCPTLMAEMQGSFNDIVTLEGASEKGYRMRMFCWATTGVPHILIDGLPIEVILVDDADPMYFSIQSNREDEQARHLKHGTISFKTCTRIMQIPASYLLKLLNSSLENGSGTRYNVKDMVFHWFLVQILSNIGSYNVV